MSWKLLKTPTFKAISHLTDDKKTDSGVEKAAREAERIAKRLVPPPSQPQANVKEPTGGGGLRGNIDSARMKNGVWKVFSNKRYAKFVEYGTGRRGAASQQPEPGVDSAYSHGSKPGMGAQPFMRPAVAEVRKKMRAFAFWR